METHVVQRPFQGAGDRKYAAHEKVDASTWPLRTYLESQKFIRPLMESERQVEQVATPSQPIRVDDTRKAPDRQAGGGKR